jgi:hypothetical protein
MTQAYVWHKKLINGEVRSIRQLANIYGYSERPVAKTLRLAFLAPDIMESILDGSQPEALTVRDLQERLPLDWQGQRKALGFEA